MESVFAYEIILETRYVGDLYSVLVFLSYPMDGGERC